MSISLHHHRNHATVTWPEKLLYTHATASELDTAVATMAVAKAAHAIDWARRGLAANEVPVWVEVLRAGVLRTPDPVSALVDEGWTLDAARTTAERITALTAHPDLPSDVPAHQWVGLTPGREAPDHERHVLLALGDLARVAAAEIADDPAELPVHGFVRSVRHGTRDDPGGERWVGMLAAPLDPPGLLEREVIELLGRTARARRFPPGLGGLGAARQRPDRAGAPAAEPPGAAAGLHPVPPRHTRSVRRRDHRRSVRAGARRRLAHAVRGSGSAAPPTPLRHHARTCPDRVRGVRVVRK